MADELVPEFEPEDVVFVQWSTIAIENSVKEIDRLRSMLQRLAENFRNIDLDDLEFAHKVIRGEAYAGGYSAIDYACEVQAASQSIATAREILAELEPQPVDLRACRVCGCTEEDCSECIEATGDACHWVEDDLCSRCQEGASHA